MRFVDPRTPAPLSVANTLGPAERIHLPNTRNTTSSSRTWARRALSWTAWLLVAALLAQVFTAGMAVFANPGWWARHRTFLHLFEGLAPVSLMLALIGRVPRAVLALAAGTVILLAVQYVTAHLRASLNTQLFAALHPVSAVVLVWTASELARRATSLMRDDQVGRAKKFTEARS